MRSWSTTISPPSTMKRRMRTSPRPALPSPAAGRLEVPSANAATCSTGFSRRTRDSTVRVAKSDSGLGRRMTRDAVKSGGAPACGEAMRTSFSSSSGGKKCVCTRPIVTSRASACDRRRAV